MSQQSAEIVAAYESYLVDVIITYSTTTLVVYEYLITLNDEITMIWRRTWTVVTWLFVTNRYLMIVSTIWAAVPATAKSCTTLRIIDSILVMSQYCVFAGFSALRVFAIWDRNVPITLLVLVLNLVPVVTNIYIYTQETIVFVTDSLLGTFCASAIDASARVRFTLALATRIAVTIGDILVLAATWHKTYKYRMDTTRTGMRTPLAHLLLRDGTAYFGALIMINVVQVLLNSVPTLSQATPIGDITPVLIPIIISRFLLNLRHLAEHESTAQHTFSSRTPLPRSLVPMLTSVFGNMGEDLVHRSAEEVDVVDEEPRLNVVGETPAVLDAVAVDPSKEFAMEDHIPNTSAGGYMD